MSTGAPLDLSYELLKDLQVMDYARSPALRPQDGWVYGMNGPPLLDAPTNASGVDVRDQMFAKAGIRLRKDPAVTKAWVRCDLADGAESYGVNIFGLSSVQVSGAATPVDTIAALKIAVDADALTASWGITTAVVGAGDILEYTIPAYLCPRPFIGYANALTPISAPPFQSLMVEATECHWRVWGQHLGSDEWAPIPGAEFIGGGGDAWAGTSQLEKLNIAEYQRIYIEVISTNGGVIPLIGPCLVDTERDSQISDGESLLATLDSDLVKLAFPVDLVGAQPIINYGSVDSAILSPDSGVSMSGVRFLRSSFLFGAGTIDVKLIAWFGEGMAWVDIMDFPGVSSGFTVNNVEIPGARRAKMQLYGNAGALEVFRFYTKVPTWKA